MSATTLLLEIEEQFANLRVREDGQWHSVDG